MECALNAIFEGLSFGAIIVLVVLGLGVIRRFYALPIAAMLEVESVDRNGIPGRAQSICLHSDTPGAVSVAKAVHSPLADYLGKAA